MPLDGQNFLDTIIYPRISFEVIPRGSADDLERIRQVVTRGLKFDPLFIDLSFGGGGRPDVDEKIRKEIRATIKVIRELSADIPIVPHLTRTGLDIANALAFLEEMADMGIYKFMLIGGDQPKGDVPKFRDEDCYKTTNLFITAVCETFEAWGLADKLELLVGVEPEGFDPLSRLDDKTVASLISAMQGARTLPAVKEAITQSYTRSGIVFPFLADSRGNQFRVPIVAGVELGAGYPKFLLDEAGKEIVRNKQGVPLSIYRVPLHLEHLEFFAGIDPKNLTRETRDKMAAIHMLELLATLRELKRGNVTRIHGFTHNGTGFFDCLEQVYPGIECAAQRGGIVRTAASLPGIRV